MNLRRFGKISDFCSTRIPQFSLRQLQSFTTCRHSRQLEKPWEEQRCESQSASVKFFARNVSRPGRRQELEIFCTSCITAANKRRFWRPRLEAEGRRSDGWLKKFFHLFCALFSGGPLFVVVKEKGFCFCSFPLKCFPIQPERLRCDGGVSATKARSGQE